MEKAKPIVATTLKGLFIQPGAWDLAHHLWFEEAARQLGDNSVLRWIDHPDYFIKGVDDVMRRLQPGIDNERERTSMARRTYFDSVIKYIETHSVVNQKVVKYFKSLKKKVTLALITTNTKQALERILAASGLVGLFDLIETSDETEKDDKRAVFIRFLKKYGKPHLYVGGDRKDSYDFCKEKGIPAIYANFEGKPEILGVDTAHNLGELKEKIRLIP